MKKRLTAFLFFSACLTLSAQSDPAPFIIKGKLENCPEKFLLIYIKNEPWMSVSDTIHIQADGSFHYETTQVSKPHRTSIQRNKVQFNDLFIAPGYELTIRADVKDYETLIKTRTFSGKGVEPNRYQLLVDSLVSSSDLVGVEWFNAEVEELISIIDRLLVLREKARKEVFSRTVDNDPFFQHFNRVAELDNTFIKLQYLITYINIGKIPLEEGEAFLAAHFDQDLLARLYNEEWLISDVYKNIVLGDNLRFIRALDYQQDSTLKDQKDYNFQKISGLFPGKMRDYAIAHMATMNFQGARSIEQLNERKEICQPYLDQVKDLEILDYVNHRMKWVTAKLGKIQVGGSAPEFSLKDPQGQLHKLSDFRGQIVYIDLWASWCAPCREETPFLNELVRTYENDDRIAFISIAVQDAYSNWQNALSKDQPLSLQLYDDDRFVFSAYTLGSIPQFVIIDREGNLVSIYAPRPSRKEELAAALETALAGSK